jgi:cytochrome c553
MKRLRLLSLALIATVAAAWTLPAWAGDCAAGKSKYVANCSGCHGSTPNAQAQLGSNPAVILTQMTDSTAPGYPSMNVLYPGTVNDTDIDDIATYLFYYPSACPVSSPILQASPAPVAFGSVTVGATSATTTVTITNAGSAAATGVGFSNSNATEFIVSANTCTATINAGANCNLKFAFKPFASGSRSGTLTVNRSGGAGVGIGMSGTGSAVATPGQSPGHTSHIVASGDSKVFIHGDVTHAPFLFVRNPGWHPFYDHDPVMSEATRRKVLDMLAANKMMVQGYHFPFPGLAHIEKTASGYREIPVPWNPVL